MATMRQRLVQAHSKQEGPFRLLLCAAISGGFHYVGVLQVEQHYHLLQAESFSCGWIAKLISDDCQMRPALTHSLSSGLDWPRRSGVTVREEHVSLAETAA